MTEQLIKVLQPTRSYKINRKSQYRKNTAIKQCTLNIYSDVHVCGKNICV